MFKQVLFVCTSNSNKGILDYRWIIFDKTPDISYDAFNDTGIINLFLSGSYDQGLWSVDVDNSTITKIVEYGSYQGRLNPTISNKIVVGNNAAGGNISSGLYVMFKGTILSKGANSSSDVTFNASSYNGKILVMIGGNYDSGLWIVNLDDNTVHTIFEYGNYPGRLSCTISNNKVITINGVGNVSNGMYAFCEV